MRFLPIAERELRVMARQNRTWWQRVCILIGALTIFAFAYVMFRRWATAGMLGREMFTTLGGFSFAYALLTGPLVTVDCLSRERRDGTLGLLFLTDLRSYDVVLGKMAAASFGVVLGLTAAAPVIAIPMLMGGVTLSHLSYVAMAISNAMFLSLAIGTFASSLCHSGRKSLALTIGVLLFLTFGIPILGVTVLGRLTSFRHLGLFPEQLPHWQWMLERLGEVRGETPRVLNLFAYTGAASLIAAQAGAEVTHVDASKRAIAWAKQNQAVSKLGEAPIRWILDDARKFVAREVRRGKSYHAILVDPPKFGRGPEGEVWDVFLHLAPLLRDCALLLAPGRASLVLTSYAIRASVLATDGLVRECLAGRPGTIESGELAVVEEAGGRLLPTSHFTRWTSTDATA
jgi:23S rRNA (cytosine1962-C5)-methyltransferase